MYIDSKLRFHDPNRKTSETLQKDILKKEKEFTNRITNYYSSEIPLLEYVADSLITVIATLF